MTRSRGIRIQFDGPDLTQVLDVSCGSCAACSGRRPYWCLDPRSEGRPVTAIAGLADLGELRRWFSLLEALAGCAVDNDAALLVLSPAPRDAVRSLVGLVHRGLTCASEDGRDDQTRATVARASATGRAHMVVASHDAQRAVKAVQRGGTVCLPDAPVVPPTVTELVQRDVQLVGPRDVTRLRDRVDEESLSHALAAVLGHGTASEARR